MIVLREWMRIFRNRKILLVAVVLLALNVGLFSLIFAGIGDYAAYRDVVRDREILFYQLEKGGITVKEISAELAQLDIIRQFFTYKNMEQNYPDVYEMAYAASAQEARETYPEIAAAFDAGEYDQQEVDLRSSALSAVLSSVDYTTEFYEKLEGVFDNAEKLSNISIFQNKDSQDSNLAKTAEDYCRLSDISVTVGNDITINALVAYSIPGIFCLLFACVVVSQTLVESHYNLRTLIYSTKNGRGRLTTWRGLGLLAGSLVFGVLLYGSTLLLSQYLLGPVDLNRMVQSVPALFGLTVPMTIGEFLGLYLACGVLVQVMLTALVWMLFSLLEQQQMALLSVVSVVGLSVLLYQVIPPQSFLAVLKYANPVAVMNFTQSITAYRNLGIGSFLIEKNWLVLTAAMIVTITCAIAAGWCGMKRYSISNHSRLYRTVQRWLRKLSQWYHGLVSRLSFGGLEGYKILVMQRGILVLALAAWIFTQSYPTREITYVGEAQFLLEFYEEFTGQGVTPELESYVNQLQKKLDDVDAEFIASQLAFQNGEIGVEEYLTQSQKYAAYDVQRDSLETIRGKIAYIREQEALGFDAVILDSMGYVSLLETSTTDQVMQLICLFMVILLSSFLFPIEQKKGLYQMVRSTQKGRTHLAKKKLVLALILSFVVFVLFAGIRMYSIAATYGLSCLTAPAHSLDQFAGSNMNLGIWFALAIYYLIQWLVFAAAAVLTCLLTLVLPQQLALLTVSAVGIGTALLSLFGFQLPTVWSALEGVTACVFVGNWMYLIVTTIALIGAWLATVCLWSNSRRGAK